MSFGDAEIYSDFTCDRHPVKIVGNNNNKTTMFYSEIPKTRRHPDSAEFLMSIFENRTDNIGYDLPVRVYVMVHGPMNES